MAQDFLPENLSRFNSNISQAKNMQERQKEIIKEVLAGEVEIGKQRIAYLNSFFDTYFTKLDQVARKCDELSDAFQIIANANKNGKPITIEYKHTDNRTGGNDGNPPKKNTNSKNSGYSSNFDGDMEALGDGEEQVKKKEEQIKRIQNFLEGLTADQHKELQKDADFQKEHADRITAYKIAQQKRVFNKGKEYADALSELEYEKSRDTEDRVLELRLQKRQELATAEIARQKTESSLAASIAYETNFTGEVAEAKAKLDEIKREEELRKALGEKRAAYIAKAEAEAKRKNNGVLSKEAAKDILLRANREYALSKDNLAKLGKEREKLAAAEAKLAERDNINKNLNVLYTSNNFEDRKKALDELTRDANGKLDAEKTASALVNAIGNLATKLENKMNSIAGYQSFIDTRLQGSSNKTYMGSYWGQLTKDMMSVGAITPYYKQEKFAENIKRLVDSGIAFDLKQRAFLMTIQEKIADTFDAADGTLLRLIRIQQEDSTAGRLGMESSLNTFLNSMYENTEYLKGVAAGVRSSLEEMEALMSGIGGAEIEYQVQKWMGSLYSVGMSQAAVNSIATAFGQIASGQIEGLTGGGAGNLIIMAANNAGLSIADMLTSGLDASNTNKLLQATVNYLAEIADSSAENRVVQQQLANVFGVKASDLRAATNLASSVSTISGNNLTYDNMLGQLMAMAGTMHKRTSMGEMMSNVWENGQYTLASSMANNPVSFLIYKMASLLDATTGGIALPFVNIMGHGVDLNTTVADLMRVAAMGTGILGSLGSMIQGLGNSFSGRAMLDQMGIRSGSGLAVTPRGSGIISGAMSLDGGVKTSGSGYIGNAASSDIKNTTIQQAEDTKKSLMVEAQEDMEKTQVDEINATVLKIYKLLDDVVNGSSTLRVRVDSYGLVNAGNHGGRNSYLAGPAGLAGQSANLAAQSGYIGNAPSAGGGMSQFFSGAVDIGNWVLSS